MKKNTNKEKQTRDRLLSVSRQQAGSKVQRVARRAVRVWKFGDAINTDLITPGRYNITTDSAALGKIAFIEHRPEFSKEVQPGDFIVGGVNFGCGSSRETAAIALRACGIAAVIAKSFARIFYRNSLNQGLIVVTADTDQISEGDQIELDYSSQVIRNHTTGVLIPASMPDVMLRLHAEGGIISYLKRNSVDSLPELFSPS